VAEHETVEVAVGEKIQRVRPFQDLRGRGIDSRRGKRLPGAPDAVIIAFPLNAGVSHEVHDFFHVGRLAEKHQPGQVSGVAKSRITEKILIDIERPADFAVPDFLLPAVFGDAVLQIDGFRVDPVGLGADVAAVRPDIAGAGIGVHRENVDVLSRFRQDFFGKRKVGIEIHAGNPGRHDFHAGNNLADFRSQAVDLFRIFFRPVFKPFPVEVRKCQVGFVLDLDVFAAEPARQGEHKAVDLGVGSISALFQAGRRMPDVDRIHPPDSVVADRLRGHDIIAFPIP